MHKFNLTLFFGFLKFVCVLCADGTPGTASSSTNAAYNILPLALVDLGDSCVNPTKFLAHSHGGKFLSETINLSVESQTQQRQVFLCGMKKDGPDATDSSDDDYCTYPKVFKNFEGLHCTDEPEPVIRAVTVKIEPTKLRYLSCGPMKTGILYKVVYKICMTNNPIESDNSSLSVFFNFKENFVKYRSEFELYRFCYDTQKNNVLYTEHKIMSPELLKDPSLQQEREKTYSIKLDAAEHFDESKKEKIREELAKFAVPTSSDDVQQLVPANDFAFALWRKPTSFVMNFKRMRKELATLWEYISDKIRDNATERNREYYIQTSARKLDIHNDSTQGSTGQQIQPEGFSKEQPPPAEQLTKKRPSTGDISKQSEREMKRFRPEGAMKNSNGENVMWLKKVYDFIGNPQGFDKLQTIKAIAIMMVSNFNNDQKLEKYLDKECGKNLCENFFTKRFEYGKLIRCCSMINKSTLFSEHYSLPINEDLEVDFFIDNGNKDPDNNRDSEGEKNKMKETDMDIDPQTP